MIFIDIKIEKSIFNPFYLDYLESQYRYEVYYGGAGSGKSFFVAQKILFKYLKFEKLKILVIRKVGRTLRDSCFSLFKSILSSWNLIKYCSINKTDMSIELPNGSSIIFKGIDDPEKIKSISNITDIWIEEASELFENDFNQLDLRLRGNFYTKKQIFITFNPVSDTHWLKKLFFDFPKNDAIVVKSTYKNNAFIDKEYYNVLENLKYTNEEYYNIYALGEWGSLGNIIFNNWSVEKCRYSESDFDDVYAGADFGFNHASAAVKVGFKDNHIYIFKEVYAKGITNGDFAELVKSILLPNQYIYCDCAEPDRIKEFNLNSINALPSKKGKNSVKNGIDFLKKHKIFVDPECSNIISELKNYQWKKDKFGNVIDEPIALNDDCIAALRYAVEPVWSYSAPQTEAIFTDISKLF